MSEDSENDTEAEIEYQINSSVDEIDLCVSGPDEEWVEETFDEKMDRLEEIADEDDQYHVEAGAGWLMAHANADSPEEAMAIWLDMWERMLDDVEDLSNQEREQAGLTRQ